MSPYLLGAFGAGPKVLEHRRRRLERLEAHIRASRDRSTPASTSDLTVEFILGGIREVAASRLRQGRAAKLPGLADELAAWAASYPSPPPEGVAVRPAARRPTAGGAPPPASQRALRGQGPLPSGPSGLPP